MELNGQFKFRAKIAPHIFFIGGLLIWGLVDGLNVVISSNSLFYNFLDKFSFIIFSAISYGILCAIIGFAVSLLPANLFLKRRHLTLNRLVNFYVSAFFTITICAYLSFFIIKLGEFRYISKLVILIIALIILVPAVYITLNFLFKKLKLFQIFFKIASHVKIKITLFTLIILLILSGIYRFYDARLLSYKASSSDLPNVILISLDTLSAKHVGCYGYSKNTTPSLDDFSKQGILFKNAYSVSRWTLPSHMSILTSLYPSVHKVRDNDLVLDEQWITIAEILRNYGYYTGAFVDGGPMSYIGAKHGFSKGFDFYNHYPDDLYIIDKFEKLFIWGKFARFYRYVNNPTPYCDMHAENITQIVISWLKHRHKKKHFFLFLHYYDIHSDFNILPYEAPFDYIKNSEAIDYILNSKMLEGATEKLTLFSQKLRDGDIKKSDFDEKEIEALITLYDAGISYTDHHIGILLNVLNKLNLSDNTIVIITADHGEEFLEHHQFLHSQFYNEVIKVPLIMIWPEKLPQDREVEFCVRSIDIAPTILDLIGIPPPEQFQGASLLPFIFEADADNKLICYGGNDSENYAHDAQYIIDNNKKLILKSEKRANYAHNKGKKIEFYDLNGNPNEISDLIQNNAEDIKQLLTKLKKWTNICRDLAAKVTSHKRLDLDNQTKEKLRALGYIK